MKRATAKGLIPYSVLDDLLSENPRVKYGRARALLAIGRTDPARLYPLLPFFADLLDNDNRILQWTAIDVIGLLAGVDPRGRTNRILPRLNTLLRGGQLIAANHVILALSHIAAAKPRLRSSIVRRLLSVPRLWFETSECRNIGIGKAIEALGEICRTAAPHAGIMRFVRGQTKNRRPATRKKAERFLSQLPSIGIERNPKGRRLVSAPAHAGNGR